MNIKRQKQQTTKSARGNVLIISCLSLTLVSLALIVAYSFCGLYFVHLRLQNCADEIALLGAKKLNDRDRLGQLNNMIARCRQLVHSSREDYEKTKQDYPDLESFAEPLLNEARESAKTLESERKRVVVLSQTEAASAMLTQFNQIKSMYHMQLPWLSVAIPEMALPHFGKIDGVESNVPEFTQFTKLRDADRNQNYVASSAGLNLYAAELNETLTTNDNDLEFKLSSLPCPVDGIIAPARLVQATSYKEVKPGYAPSVAQILLRIKVETGLGLFANATMYAQSTASTTGASLQR